MTSCPSGARHLPQERDRSLLLTVKVSTFISSLVYIRLARHRPVRPVSFRLITYSGCILLPLSPVQVPQSSSRYLAAFPVHCCPARFRAACTNNPDPLFVLLYVLPRDQFTSFLSDESECWARTRARALDASRRAYDVTRLP